MRFVIPSYANKLKLKKGEKPFCVAGFWVRKRGSFKEKTAIFETRGEFTEFRRKRRNAKTIPKHRRIKILYQNPKKDVLAMPQFLMTQNTFR